MTGRHYNIAGIDPGLQGALCVLSPEGAVLDLLDLPIITVNTKPARTELDEPRIRDMLMEWNIRQSFMEKAQPMPKQGLSSPPPN